MNSVATIEPKTAQPRIYQKTNVQAVTDIMEFSMYGPLAQLFIIDALLKHSTIVADASVEEFASVGSAFISPVAWQGVAREIKRRVELHLESVS
jgi:hypothetical protein